MTTNAQKVVALSHDLEECRQRIHALEAENKALRAERANLEQLAHGGMMSAGVVHHANVQLLQQNEFLQQFGTISTASVTHGRSIHELQKENEDLKTQIKALERDNAELRTENASLKIRVSQLEGQVVELHGLSSRLEEQVTALQRVNEAAKRHEDRREALLLIHDVTYGAKCQNPPLVEALNGLDKYQVALFADAESSALDSLAAQQESLAEQLCTSSSVLTKLWELNTERHSLSHTRVRGRDGMKHLAKRAQDLVKAETSKLLFTPEELEAARFAVDLYTAVITKKKTSTSVPS